MLLMMPTLRTVLRCQPVVRADPEVLSGEEQLDRQVRWVHVSEVGDIAALLSGGELILTTGLWISDPSTDPAAYIDSLIGAGACALIVELSSRVKSVPDAALQRARAGHFPIIALHRTSRFVEITELIHRDIVAARYADLEFAQRVHQTFTALSLETARPQQIVESAAELAQMPIVLEDLSRHVVAHAPEGTFSATVLQGWASRSRATSTSHETAVCGPEGWITSPVGTARNFWGRIVAPDAARPSSAGLARIGMVLERAAQALELGRMIESDRLSLSHQAQGGLLTNLADSRVRDERTALVRAESLGLPRSKRYLPVTARMPSINGDDPLGTHQRSRDQLNLVSEAVRKNRIPALVGLLRPGQVGLVIAAASEAQEQRHLERLARTLTRAMGDAPDERLTLGVGPSNGTLRAAGAALRLAEHIAEAASMMPPSERGYYRSSDVRLRGLIALLRGDSRLQAFADSELDPLLAHAETHQSDHLTDVLRAFLECGGNKALLARVTHRSRPAIYRDLQQIERLLGVSLETHESRLALGVALMAHEQDRVGASDQ